ncbi:MAG: metal-sensitive transcriptional regulator [Kiritimatiellales bacterium]|nr:metal-sensitive transcriptional regulator [Kiritimatiellales bacterium]
METPKKSTVVKRLHIIQGQLSGLESMLESDKECFDVLPQFKAVKAGLQTAFALYLQLEADTCLGNKSNSKKREKMQALLLELART